MSINITTAYKINIRIPFGKLREVVQWCEDNLIGDWKFSEDDNPEFPHADYNYYIFMFESERDYVAFNIWKK